MIMYAYIKIHRPHILQMSPPTDCFIQGSLFVTMEMLTVIDKWDLPSLVVIAN